MRNIALCLSGGGLRATFFHFGVVRLLRDARLLGKVSHIFSVSGGSILAAHLVANWEDYIGTDEQFAKAEKALISLARQDIRGNAVRRWLLTWPLDLLFYSLGLTRYLEREYAKFLNHAALADLHGSDEAPRPELHLLTTSLTTGELCSFSRHGLHLWDPKRDQEPLDGSAISLARGVAASSAFPPLFPPVAITTEMLSVGHVGKLPREPEYLIDGGIFDNFGSELAGRLCEEGSLDAECILVSDAGASFNWDIKRDNWWILPRNVRSTNILMKRVTDLTLSQSSARKPTRVMCSISATLPEETEGVLPLGLQRLMSFVRTDLDDFSDVNSLLSRHGYDVAYQALQEEGVFDRNLKRVPPSPFLGEEWDGKQLQKHSKILKAAQRLRITVINFRDWAFVVVLIKFVLVAPLVTYFGLNFYRQSILRDATKPVASAPSSVNDVFISGVPRTDNPDEITASRLSTDSASRTFINRAGEPVELYWVDTGGKQIPYGVLAPSQTVQITTYVGHLWIAKTQRGAVLLNYVVH
ncbi:patatin-like phospholipase family protein [Bradyrhizobium sp. CCGUVB14]|uniref:patatin-like phospholipase family protein n=1 Tax=Bradyrhizobium sp. CCGUVB14 TaxID=2949628 RepID=UPI0020B358C8|nr:patatin-like phospholipase family protein [Bradyrhizobium sp. CCGUVB14]MCP3445285.1 patatin-like phospholipase family protein [Bradyrhizobium sp. CCGUVB14]